jgi:ATP-dependent helicase STH1/SNF2
MPSMSYIAQYHAFGLLSLALPYSAQKHVEQLSTICAHGREVLSVNRTAQDHVICLGKAVLSFHTHVECKEQKRIEHISKERLKALKADDEEAYMKLIHTAKALHTHHPFVETDGHIS